MSEIRHLRGCDNRAPCGAKLRNQYSYAVGDCTCIPCLDTRYAEAMTEIVMQEEIVREVENRTAYLEAQGGAT